MLEGFAATYLGIFLLLVFTGAGLPVPEEVLVIIAGVASFHGQLDPWLALTSCIAGALTGDCVMYWVGYHFGRGILHQKGWLIHLLHPEREQQVERMIQKHGLKVFLLARFLVGLRSPLYIAAGILRVPFRRFLIVDFFCATLVISTFFGLSYMYAERITGWWQSIRRLELGLTVAIVALAICTAIVLYRRHVRERLARSLVECDAEIHDRPRPAEDSQSVA